VPWITVFEANGLILCDETDARFSCYGRPVYHHPCPTPPSTLVAPLLLNTTTSMRTERLLFSSPTWPGIKPGDFAGRFCRKLAQNQVKRGRFSVALFHHRFYPWRHKWSIRQEECEVAHCPEQKQIAVLALTASVVV